MHNFTHLMTHTSQEWAETFIRWTFVWLSSINIGGSLQNLFEYGFFVRMLDYCWFCFQWTQWHHFGGSTADKTSTSVIAHWTCTWSPQESRSQVAPWSQGAFKEALRWSRDDSSHPQWKHNTCSWWWKPIIKIYYLFCFDLLKLNWQCCSAEIRWIWRVSGSTKWNVPTFQSRQMDDHHVWTSEHGLGR